jgi:hypothetical protein
MISNWIRGTPKEILDFAYRQTSRGKCKYVRQKVSKAGKLLGYIRRNTMFVTDITPGQTLYLALVRSHFGYGSQIFMIRELHDEGLLNNCSRPGSISNSPFFFFEISIENVSMTLRNLKANKSTGLDKIPAKILKLASIRHYRSVANVYIQFITSDWHLC